MSRFRKALTAGLAGAVLVSASVAAIAQVGDDVQGPPGSASPAASPPGSEPAVRSVGPAVAESIAALTRARTAADALPPDVAEYVEWAPIEGASGRHSRKTLTRDGLSLYVMPGDGVACVILTGPGPGATGPLCETPLELKSGSGGPGVLHNDCVAAAGAESSVPTCRGATLFGMVPDGVQEVTVELESGRSVSTQVTDNTYLLDVSASPQAVHFTSQEGAVRQVTP